MSNISRFDIASLIGLLNLLKNKDLERPEVYRALLAILCDYDPGQPGNRERTIRYISLLVRDKELANLCVMALPETLQSPQQSKECATSRRMEDSVFKESQGRENVPPPLPPVPPVPVTSQHETTAAVSAPVSESTSSLPSSTAAPTLPVFPSPVTPYFGYPFLQYSNYQHSAMPVPWTYVPCVDHLPSYPTLQFPQLQATSMLMSPRSSVQEKSLDLSKTSPLLAATATAREAAPGPSRHNQRRHKKVMAVKRRAMSDSQPPASCSFKAGTYGVDSRQQAAKHMKITEEKNTTTSHAPATDITDLISRTIRNVGSPRICKPEVSELHNGKPLLGLPRLYDGTKVKKEMQLPSQEAPKAGSTRQLITRGWENPSVHELVIDEGKRSSVAQHSADEGKRSSVAQHPAAGTRQTASSQLEPVGPVRNNLTTFPYSQEFILPNGKTSVVSFKGDCNSDKIKELQIALPRIRTVSPNTGLDRAPGKKIPTPTQP